MNLRRGMTVLLSASALALIPSVADAGHKNLAVYCSPSGDVCTQVFRNTRTDEIKLRLATFAHRGRYNLCIKPDGGSTDCDSYRLRRGSNGLNQSTIDWRSNYPASGAKQTVSWRKNGDQLGPTLKFDPSS